MLKSLNGWKTVTGLAAVVGTFAIDKFCGDTSGAAPQAAMWLLGLFGGGMTAGGLIDKVKKEAVVKAQEAVSNKTNPYLGSITAGALSSLMDAVMDSMKASIGPTKEEIAAAQQKAQSGMTGYDPGASAAASAKMDGYKPADAEPPSRQPSRVNSDIDGLMGVEGAK